MIGELSSEQIEILLHTEVIGRIGVHSKGRNYIFPVTYAYDGERVIVHSAEGLKVSILREGSEVCFETESVSDLSNWKSVMAWGSFEELRDAEAMSALNLLVERVRPFLSAEALAKHGHKQPARAVLYGIRLKEKTVRFETR